MTFAHKIPVPDVAMPSAAASGMDCLGEGMDQVHDFAVALLATGATFEDAVLSTIACHGAEPSCLRAMEPLFLEWAGSVPSGEAVVAFLTDLAAVDRDGANAWLGSALVSGALLPWELEDSSKARARALHFQGCAWITALPEGLAVDGCVVLDNCTSLRELPAGLVVGTSMGLSGCTALEYLPQDLTVGGNLIMEGCSALKCLPNGLKLGAGLHMKDCTSLTSLPDGLHVKGPMDLRGCSSLKGLPGDLRVDGSLSLMMCVHLENVPKGLTLGRGIDLTGCAALRQLPAGFQVRDWLMMEGCTSMVQLPAGLKVGGPLALGGCSSWDGRIPSNAVVGGQLTTDAHPYPGIPLWQWRERHPQGEGPC